MANNQSSGFLGGLLIGSALGAVTGLLLAPKAGRETRKLLRKSADALPELAEDLATSLQLQADRLSDTALQNWEGTLVRLKEAIAAGVEAGLEENRRLNRPKTAIAKTSAKTSPSSTDELREVVASPDSHP